MTDNFLSNDNYYNRGGLKSKPKEPRPTLIKGQSDKIKDLQEQLKRKEEECEELKKELEAVYDDCKGCPTCNEALYNANLYAKEYRKLKQALDEIEKYLDAQQKYFDGEDYHNLLDIINKAKDSK